MFTLALILSGCAPAMRVSKVGRRFPPNPPDCTIKWENLAPEEAITRYEHVGVVGLGIQGEEDIDTSPALKEMVRIEACRVGADAALIGMNSAFNPVFGSRRSGVSVTLLRKRDKPPAWSLPGAFGIPAQAEKGGTPDK